MRALTLLHPLAWAMLAVGCGSAAVLPDGGDLTDDGSSPGSDGAIDADVTCADECDDPDAGRSLGDDCNALLDQCGAGLTCTYGPGATLEGICRAIGPLGEGEQCGVDGGGTPECGEAMACGPLPLSSGVPPYYCQIMCDVDDPLERCTLDQSCERFSLDEPRLGFCYDP